jgi:hypothetical protein
MVNNSCILCITTPDGTPNAYFDNTINMPRPGDEEKTLFKQEHIELVCLGCKKRGVSDECKHSRGLQPAWIDSTRRLFSAAMIPDEDDRNRELRGIKSIASQFCFDAPRVKQIFTLPRLKVLGFPQSGYVFLDTNRGNEDEHATISSKFAMISVLKNFDGGYLIIGAEDIINNKPSDYMPQVKAHMRDLKKRFPSTQFYAAIENNHAQDSGWISDVLIDENYKNVIFAYEKELKVGIKTTGPIKLSMMLLLDKHINEGKINICQDFTTSAENPEDVLNELRDQLCRYSKIKSKPKEPSDTIKVKFSGKIQKGYCDDLAVVLQMAVYWIPVFDNDPRYAKYRQQH